MTIRDLYNWAEKNNCTDLELYKNCQLDMFHIEDVYIFDFDLAEKCGIEPRVVLD